VPRDDDDDESTLTWCEGRTAQHWSDVWNPSTNSSPRAIK